METPTPEQEQQQQEISLEQAKREIKLMKAFKRLAKTSEFKLIIQEEYMTNEAVRMVMAKGEAMPKEAHERLAGSIYGPSALHAFFLRINQVGQSAEVALHDFEQAQADTQEEI
jgi:hypothetical protein